MPKRKKQVSGSGAAKGNRGILPEPARASNTAIAAKSYRTKILIGIFAIIIIATAVILPIMLMPDAPAYQYTDTDFVFQTSTIDYITDKYDILLPAEEFFIDEQFNSYDIAVSQTDGEEVYLLLNFFSLEYFDDVQVVVVLVDNYDYKYKMVYEELTISDRTDIFDYKYEVYPLSGTAMAYFQFGGYKYYIDLMNSFEPERITSIISALALA